MTSSSKSSSVPPPQPSQPEKLLAASHIPLIDLAPLLSGKDKQSVATLIDHACRTSGFFAIKSHGIAKEIVTEMLHTSKAFFDLPAHEKQLLSTGQTRDYPYGYSGVMEETLSVGKAMEHNLDKRTEEEDASSDEFFSMTTPASAPLPDLKVRTMGSDMTWRDRWFYQGCVCGLPLSMSGEASFSFCSRMTRLTPRFIRSRIRAFLFPTKRDLCVS